jgi:MFS family permease
VRRYLVSTALASVGLNLLVTVLFKQAFDLTGNELDIGWIGLAQFVPAVLLVLVSGWVADRFDRRRVTALFLSARSLCAGALVAYSLMDVGRVWPLFGIAFAFGAADAMLSPARRAIPPLITTPADFPQVIALWTATFTGAAIVGPVLGGFLYSVGPEVAYAVAGGLELLAVLPILRIVYVREPGRLSDRPTLSAALEDVVEPRLLRFYARYRACVRARLALAHLNDPSPREPERWQPLARAYLRLGAEFDLVPAV